MGEGIYRLIDIQTTLGVAHEICKIPTWIECSKGFFNNSQKLPPLMNQMLLSCLLIEFAWEEITFKYNSIEVILR